MKLAISITNHFSSISISKFFYSIRNIMCIVQHHWSALCKILLMKIGWYSWYFFVLLLGLLFFYGCFSNNKKKNFTNYILVLHNLDNKQDVFFFVCLYVRNQPYTYICSSIKKPINWLICDTANHNRPQQCFYLVWSSIN